jgi:hypothetical protein
MSILTSDKFKLLFGPYQQPALKRGNLAYCYYRDALVVVTTWSNAPISWPRGYVPSAENRGGGPGFIVDDELARAVQNESAAAVGWWWGVSSTTVAKWRKVLDVKKTNNEGSRRLMEAATAKALEVALEVGVSEEDRERRRKLMKEVKPWLYSPDVTYGVPWTPEHLAILGTMPDKEVASRTGHTLNAVQVRRHLDGIPCFRLKPPSGAHHDPRTDRWYASICVDGVKWHLGTFDTKGAAEAAYQDAVRRFRSPGNTASAATAGPDTASEEEKGVSSTKRWFAKAEILGFHAG